MAKVLLVEDDNNLSEIFKMRLQAEGYTTMVAADGEEGLKLARAVRPDLITLDVMMPRLDGWTLLALLKQDESLAPIPVILLTILDHREQALSYALTYARDMDKGLADRFVGMYVNDWTLDYGPRGREAVRCLLDEGHKAGVIPNPVAVEFVD